MREIVATQVANDLINNLGITAAYRLQTGWGTTLRDIALAFVAAKDIFKLDAFQAYLAQLDNRIPAETQAGMMINMERRVRRATRWFLARWRGKTVGEYEPEREVEIFRKGVQQVNVSLGDAIAGSLKEAWLDRCEQFREIGINEEWTLQMAMPDNLFSGLCIVEVARTSHVTVLDAAKLFYALHDKLNLDQLATHLSDVSIETHWQAVAREAFLNDLEAQLRVIISAILERYSVEQAVSGLDEWLSGESHWLKRWLVMVNEIQNSRTSDFALFSV